ncbi:hypothetical protein T440DRAFT_398685 [Plenodomus tracheiphilus IPT5]|uniref:FHA domain-containing protein n=1 Tax=Plenodomus tracheiphilus IPT5 TaxID=1408161 RepID=A0A6A7B2E9_9PLEO|nr:hypothetical protein T440DRAFT_398685 [Plenodomus tracheiphilus IPT5]
MDGSPSKMLPQSLVESTEVQQPELSRPALLPAFGDETFSSSPFPRPRSSKRKFEPESPTFPKQELKYYPTPVPTSSTGILHSSSPRHARPGVERTFSALSERTPLGAVPTVDLPADGEIVRMGRSSNSADYQLSTNRLISRVHVQAAYHAPTALYAHGHIEIECLGWNGAKIHCKGRVFELSKGDTYVSENPETEIILDVQDTRVMVAWPAIPAPKLSWDSEEEGTLTPTRGRRQSNFDSSPPVIPRSPVSQSPIRPPVFAGLGQAPQPGTVQVFEDADASEESPSVDTPGSADQTFIRPALPGSRSSQDAAVLDSKTSILSSFAADDFSDNDEENDPVVHSFGPFGQNLLNGLASFNTATTPTQANPPRLRAPLLSPSPRRAPVETFRFKESPIKNHVINQLAFSRIHSQPLSAIHSNLPAELKACVAKGADSKMLDSNEAAGPVHQLSRQDLKRILDETPCVGEIPRAGKDAAGQPLENEFYYVPEMDTNQMRRETITAGTRSTGLRSVRKTHKQYYWKKPRV